MEQKSTRWSMPLLPLQINNIDVDMTSGEDSRRGISFTVEADEEAHRLRHQLHRQVLALSIIIIFAVPVLQHHHHTATRESLAIHSWCYPPGRSCQTIMTSSSDPWTSGASRSVYLFAYSSVCLVICLLVYVSSSTPQQKIAQASYRDVDELERDVVLLCKNAQTYNVEGG